MTAKAFEPLDGLSPLADGTLLRGAVAADPLGWLGREHVERFGPSTELLVKLLDAGERLPVHVHPDRAYSRRHLGLAHGKTEAWLVLEADPGAQVRVGFAAPMRPSDVRALVAAQDADALVGSLRAIPVRAGDAVLVPAGLPHCIDAGIFVLELQEPTDLSILLEWTGFDLPDQRDGQLGLDLDTALDALRLDPLDPAELDQLVLPRERVVEAEIASRLPPAADPYFRAHRVRPTAAAAPLEPGFAVLLTVAGAGTLVTASGARLELSRGDAVVVPWSAGAWRLTGPIEALVCRPPAPHATGASAGHAREAPHDRP